VTDLLRDETLRFAQGDKQNVTAARPLVPMSS